MATGNNGGIETLAVDYFEKSKNNNVYIFAWESGICGDRIRKSGGIVYELHKYNNLSKIRHIKNICKRENPDIIVVQHSSPLLRLATFYLSKYKVIVYQHYYFEKGNGFKNYIKLHLNRACLNKAYSVIAISKAVKTSLMNNAFVDEKKIIIIYNGVNTEKFNLLPHEYDGTVHFVYVGRLIEEKGVQVSLKALSRLDKCVNWDFTIAGDGLYKEELIKITKELKLEDRVIFLGDTNNVKDVYQNSDVFIHSCIWEEGFGITLVEAMASGKLCICSNTGAIPEIVDRNYGWLVKANDDKDLVNALIDCINKKNEWSYRQNGLINSAKNFGIEYYSESFDRYLNELVIRDEV